MSNSIDSLREFISSRFSEREREPEQGMIAIPLKYSALDVANDYDYEHFYLFSKREGFADMQSAIDFMCDDVTKFLAGKTGVIIWRALPEVSSEKRFDYSDTRYMPFCRFTLATERKKAA